MIVAWLLRFQRRIVQCVSLFALNGAFLGGQAKAVCVPVMNCHACAFSLFACPVGVIVSYAGYRMLPFLLLGTILLIGIFLARLLCGWVCPMGFLQDLLHKIPGRKISLPDWTRYIKYVLLGVTVVLLPFLLGGDTLWSFCRICPVSAMQVTIPNLFAANSVITIRTVLKLAILAFILLLAVVSKRSFCRVLCPVGAMMAPFNRFSFLTVRPVSGCVACKKCDKLCPTECGPAPDMIAGKAPGLDPECVTCHECREGCPVTIKARHRKSA
ncbi:MAG: 4Fe-4S binding protein [Kiritimatiellia bacterium]